MKLLVLLIAASLAAQTISVAPLPSDQQAAVATALKALESAKTAKDAADTAYAQAQKAYVLALDGVMVANGHSTPDCVYDPGTGATTRTYREVEIKGGYAISTAGVDDCTGHIHMQYDPATNSVRRIYVGTHNPLKATGATGGTGK